MSWLILRVRWRSGVLHLPEAREFLIFEICWCIFCSFPSSKLDLSKKILYTYRSFKHLVVKNYWNVSFMSSFNQNNSVPLEGTSWETVWSWFCYKIHCSRPPVGYIWFWFQTEKTIFTKHWFFYFCRKYIWKTTLQCSMTSKIVWEHDLVVLESMTLILWYLTVFLVTQCWENGRGVPSVSKVLHKGQELQGSMFQYPNK